METGIVPINVDLGASSNVKCQGCRARQGGPTASGAGWWRAVSAVEPGLCSYLRETPQGLSGAMVVEC